MQAPFLSLTAGAHDPSAEPPIPKKTKKRVPSSHVNTSHKKEQVAKTMCIVSLFLYSIIL